PRHAGGTGWLRPGPIRYRVRSANAARQAQALPNRPPEIRMIRYPLRLPLVGDRPLAPVRCENPKTKTLLRRENQLKFVAFACLPLVGHGGSIHHRKGDSAPNHLPAGFRLILG